MRTDTRTDIRNVLRPFFTCTRLDDVSPEIYNENPTYSDDDDNSVAFYVVFL